MPTPLLFPYGPFQPLGLITVATPGTPVPLSQNIGVYYSSVGKSEYALQFNQVLIQATLANTGNIVLVVPGGSINNTDSIIFTLGPGSYLFLGGDAPARNTFDLNSFWIDSNVGGSSAQVTGYTGG